MDASRIRKKKFAFSQISGYVWTWPEGSIICQLPQERILDAVLGLLGSFYTSIMYTYTQCKAILAFLEQALLEIGWGRHLSQFPPFAMTCQMPESVRAGH